MKRRSLAGPLLLILVALILRGVAFEYRGKIADSKWAAGWDWAIIVGTYLPALLWGVAFANVVQGVQLDAGHNYTGTFFDLLNPYALLGGVTTLLLFFTHGVVFVSLKTDGDIRLRARKLDPTREWISCDGDEDLRPRLTRSDLRPAGADGRRLEV